MYKVCINLWEESCMGGIPMEPQNWPVQSSNSSVFDRDNGLNYNKGQKFNTKNNTLPFYNCPYIFKQFHF